MSRAKRLSAVFGSARSRPGCFSPPQSSTAQFSVRSGAHELIRWSTRCVSFSVTQRARSRRRSWGTCSRQYKDS